MLRGGVLWPIGIPLPIILILLPRLPELRGTTRDPSIRAGGLFGPPATRSTPWRSLGRCRPRPLARLALALDQLGDEERQLERLLGVEARVAIGVVAVAQVRVGDGARRRRCIR